MGGRVATGGDLKASVAEKRPVATARPPAAPSPSKAAPRAIAAATVVFVVVFTWLVLHKHAHLGTRAFDLAIFDQGLWLLSEGETPFVTVRGLHIFADHTSFLLIPLVPLYWIWADVRVLLVLTVLAMAAGGPLVYAAARAERVDRWPAAALGVGYLLLPAVQWQVWDVFHPETLAVPLLIAAYLLALRSRPGWALAVLAVVLLAKEDAALVVVPLALYLGIRFRHRWLAAGGTALGLGALALNFMVLLPHWSPTGELIYSSRYGAFGDSIPGIIWGIVTSPGEVVARVAAADQPLYLVGLIVPLIASLFAPEVLLVAVPTLMANLLSTHGYQARIEYHYTAYVIAVVAIAAVVGMRRLMAWSARRSPSWARTVIGVVLVAALAGSILGGPWGLGRRSPWAGHAPRSDLVSEAVALVPPDASVAGDSRIVTHLAHRTTVYVFPNPVQLRNWSAGGLDPPPQDDFDWLVIRHHVEGMDPLFLETFNLVMESGEFVEVLDNGEVAVYQRSP